MDDTGKKQDVLIENIWTEDQKTGLKNMQEGMLIVWADPKVLDVIKSVPGVSNAFCNISPVKYEVFLDPRYDREFVQKEIEAKILCR
jgi:hypothetical protein